MNNDPLSVIYNEGYWRINRVSPMHNLTYSELKFKQYAAKIRQAIVSVPTNSSQRITVSFDVNQFKFSNEDSDGIMITVSSAQANNRTREVYVAILLSWGVSITIENVVHLPYMLERGELRIGAAVKNNLKTIFDCNIEQYNFTQLQLLLFGFNLIEYDTSKRTDPFTLNYKTPQANFKDKLAVTFEIGDIHAIWNGIKDEEMTESDLVYAAFQILQNQIYHMLTLDIIVFDLFEVILPKASVKNNGIVKMKTPDLVHAVFQVLNSISEKYLLHEVDNEDI